MNIRKIRTRIFKEGENIEQFIIENIGRLKEGDILCVTSKIVALAEKRTAAPEEKTALIKKESLWAMPTKYAWLTLKDGILMPSAGIDESNAQGKIILLPKNSFVAAGRLHRALRKHYKLKRFGVLITDSHVLPLRTGVVGIALGYAGFSGIKDYRGSPDLFGKRLKITRVNVADSLATAAVFAMGEGAERTPLAIIRAADVQFRQKIIPRELIIPVSDDLYAPFFRKVVSDVKTQRIDKRKPKP